MRVPIALQLALLVLLPSLLGLAVISVATWINNYRFVVGVKNQSISLTASLKANQIASDLELVQSSCKTVVTRILIQTALRRFYLGNNTDANWVSAITDVQSALGSGVYTTLYQAIIFSKDGTGDPNGVLNVTGSDIQPVTLPYTHPNGTSVMLGEVGSGYPPMLYPNLTYHTRVQDGQDGMKQNVTTVNAFPDMQLGLSSSLLLGPLIINASFALVSVTLPIINNTSASDILGFMTVVASAERLERVLESREGLDRTGLTLLLGPASIQNRFPNGVRPATATTDAENPDRLGDVKVKYIFPPETIERLPNRHHRSANDPPFPLSEYPAVPDALSRRTKITNNASSTLKTTNEEGAWVAVGIARAQSTLVDWVVIVEQNHSEAWAPVVHLRNIILACVFGVAGFIILVVPPLAHWSVAPIRRLREATMKTIDPTGGAGYHHGSQERFEHCHIDKKGGIVARLKHIYFGSFGGSDQDNVETGRQKNFRVPGKVREKKRWITDEMSELTSTYNEMSDELMIQYTKLEDRVQERTRELEISKKAAEAANESKTLFIANISHELKTPLNGILGMCAVCMGEDDLERVKKSLRIVYKSGELLLHLLNDLLTFSKNEIDKVIQLDEKEFRLSDIRSQIASVFQKQIQEKNIDFGIQFIGPSSPPLDPEQINEKQVPLQPAMGPPGTGKMIDMVLWGDQHRILQILINLVSNSLKFTPDGGRVELRIKCLGEVDMSLEHAPKPSFDSRTRRRSKTPSAAGSKLETEKDQIPKSAIYQDLGSTSPPLNAKSLNFEFQVEDTGPGIPAHLQQRVFEPFMQGDPGLSKKHGGTGLGLSICSQLSQLMNGTIKLHSIEGVGTTFTFSLPLKFVKEATPSTRSMSITSIVPSVRSSISKVASQSSTSLHFEQDLEPRLVGLSQPFFAAAPATPASKSDPQTPIEPETDGKVRVLVAEDNAVNQEVVLRMLKLEDVYDVTIAKDGQEAYDVVKANMEEGKAFNLILMDIQMPNLDGLQSTRMIRQMGYSAPIVALSAFSEESNIKDCMDSGMDMFLSKPLRRPALKQVLNSFSTIQEEPEAER